MSNTTRRLPRKTIVLSITAVLALIAGVAFALYLLNAKITGSVSTQALSYSWLQSPTPTGSGTAASCSVSTNSPTDTLQGVSVVGYPGDTCTVTASMNTSGSETARVTGIALTGLPSGWTAEVLPATCGKEILTIATPVSFKVTVGPSGSGTIGGGLSLSPKSQTGGATSNVGACAVQTAP